MPTFYDDQKKLSDKSDTMNEMRSVALSIMEGAAGQDFIFCMEEGRFYTYENGYWKNIFEFDFLGIIEEKMPIVTKHSINTRKQILENFKIIGRKNLAAFNDTNFINLENGMFDPLNMVFLPHKKEYYSTIRLPYIYDPSALCPLWLKTLGEIFENDPQKENLFQEFIGYCLTPDVKQKKALLLLGNSNSGKSTLLFLVRDLIGGVNCSSVPLKFLANPQYTPLLINKLLNIDADVDKSAKDYEREFKIITTGEPVSCNQKHIPTFEFVPVCRIILAANEFPRITDHSSAFYKRLLLIPCDRIFEEVEQNKNLADQLRLELPGIFNWALAGLKRLRARGVFEQHEFMRAAVKELEDENNPINEFFEDFIETDVSGGFYIVKSDLYEKYKTWAVKTNNYILSRAKFGACVYKQFSKFTPKTTSLDGKRIWRNLRYITTPSMGWDEQESSPALSSATGANARADREGGG